jgi:hypothetical protein
VLKKASVWNQTGTIQYLAFLLQSKHHCEVVTLNRQFSIVLCELNKKGNAVSTAVLVTTLNSFYAIKCYMTKIVRNENSK